VAADVGADERGGRAGADQPVQRVDELGEGRVLRAAEPPLRHVGQLLQPLVPLVHRVEERHRIGGVDQHRQSELTGCAQYRHHARVVRAYQRAGRVADREPQVLPDLDPTGARAHRLLQLGGQVSDHGRVVGAAAVG
jgi:hypothetical protein